MKWTTMKGLTTNRDLLLEVQSEEQEPAEAEYLLMFLRTRSRSSTQLPLTMKGKLLLDDQLSERPLRDPPPKKELSELVPANSTMT